MPQIYKALTAILAFAGCASLIITGQLNPVMLISGIGLIPGYTRFWRGRPAISKWTVGGLSIAALILFAFDSLVMATDTFIAVAHLTIVFQALKSFDLKEPWDHLQVYFMSLLQLIIASELTRSAAFGVIFVVFLIALVTAMVISHFLKEGTIKRINFRGPVTAISILTLITTGMFFIAAPRVKGGITGKSHAKGIKTAGFSEKVDFGSFGEVKLDTTIIMRVETAQELAFPLYWRGMTLDYFDGISWENKLKTRYRMNKEEDVFTLMPFSKEKAIVQRIFLEPLDSDVIFGIGSIAGIETDIRAMFFDHAGAVFTPEKLSRRLNYTVYSHMDEPQVIRHFTNYLQMPAGFQRVTELSKEITKNAATNNEKALRIESYLKTNYKYSLKTSPPAQGLSPVEDFLFVSKQGYCEHYATAMILMLRAIGIPSRIVTGFINGEKTSTAVI